MFPLYIRELFRGAAVYKPIDYSPILTALLFHYFPPEDYYSFYPSKKRPDCRGRPTKPWFFTLECWCNSNVFLLVDIRCADDLSSSALRARADAEIRAILCQFTQQDTKASKISAVSCFGPKFCLYEFDIGTKTITPEAPPKGKVPSGWWDHDFETQEGGTTFEQLAAEVNLLARNFSEDWPSILRERQVAEEQQVVEEQPTSDHGVTTRSRSKVVKKQPTSNYGVITRSRSQK